MDSLTNIHTLLKSHITQLYFMLHRNQERGVRTMIREIFRLLHNQDTFYESMLRRIVMHTRNIRKGKGERFVFYVCVVEWFSYNPIHALQMIDSLVFEEPSFPGSPYGSWRDIRDIAKYVYQTRGYTHPIIRYCVYLFNRQLLYDFTSFLSRTGTRVISNAVKWVPKERANWKWLFYALVAQWSDTYLYTNPDVCCMKYRKMCSALNAHLLTQHYGKPFRICDYPGKMISLALSSKDAIPDLLWPTLIENVRSHVGAFSNVLPMVDARLEGNDMHTAIGLSLVLAELSSLGKRILCMGHNPAWISIPSEYGLVKSAKHVSTCLSESPLCRVQKSIDLLIQSFVESGMTSVDIEPLCLVVFSSMDFGEVALHDKIHAIFRIHSLQMPHIVYWGISATGMPCEFDTPRTTVVSGESSAGFQMICDMHLRERRDWNPYLAIRRNL